MELFIFLGVLFVMWFFSLGERVPPESTIGVSEKAKKRSALYNQIKIQREKEAEGEDMDDLVEFFRLQDESKRTTRDSLERKMNDATTDSAAKYYRAQLDRSIWF